MKQCKIAALLAALLLLVGCGTDTTSAVTDAESQIPTDTGTETVIETEPVDPIEARTLQDDVLNWISAGYRSERLYSKAVSMTSGWNRPSEKY